MPESAELMLMTLVLGFAATVTGRLLVAAFDMSLLRGPEPESLAVCAYLGTGLLALSYGWAAHSGLRADQGLLVTVSVLSGLTVIVAARSRLREVLLPPRSDRCFRVLVLALVCRATVFLLPVAMGCSYNPFHDSSFYSATAEWLQNHGFHAPPDLDPHQPFIKEVLFMHSVSHRMGPMFLHALVRAVVPFRTAAELYPVGMTWGTMLNIAGVFVLARWGLRVPRSHAAAGTLLIALAVNSLSSSSNTTFLCQVYGTAALAFVVALLTRLQCRANWSPGNAVLLGLSLSTALTMYSEISPVLFLAALISAAFTLLRLGRGRRNLFLRFVGLVLLSLAVFGNIECLRAVRSVPAMASLRFGWHVDAGYLQYASLAFGFSRHWPGISLAGLVTLVGLAWTLRHRRAVPLCATLLVLAGLVLFLRFAVLDPWTGHPGHTYKIFRSIMWLFPVVAALQVAGLWRLIRPLRPQWPVAAVVGLTVLCAAVPMQLEDARGVVNDVCGRAGPDSSVRALGRLARRIDEHAPRRLYLVSEPRGPWPRALPAYLLCSRSFTNGWSGSGFFEVEWLRDDLPEAFEPGTLFFQHGRPPFSSPLEVLPFGYSIVDGTRPLIFKVESTGGLDGEPGSSAASTWLCRDCLVFFVFSPRRCRARLSFLASPEPGLPGPLSRALCVRDGKGSSTTRVVLLERGSTVELAVSLSRGISQVQLQCLDGQAITDPTGCRPRPLKVSAAKITEEPRPGLDSRAPREW